MNTSAPVYYFSTGSRYSYLSMSRVPDMEKRLGVRFEWVPVNGKRIRQLRGADPFQGPPQSGQYDWAYRERDAIAWADFYGIEFNEPTDVEFDVELLLRGVIAASRQADVREFAWQLARAVFARGCWPLDQAVVEMVAAEVGLDVARLSRDCGSAELQAELEANCSRAVQQGVFGTPSVMLGDKLYWGNDRLVLLEHALQQQQAQRQPVVISGLDHVVLRSAQPEALVGFYTALLGCEVERKVKDFLWQLRVGDSLLDIMRAQKPAVGEPSGGANMDHFCLRVVDYDEQHVLSHLQQHGLEGSAAGHIYGARGFGPSVYFIDPDGNRVELKTAAAGPLAGTDV